MVLPAFRGTATVPAHPHLYIEWTVAASTSALAFRRELAQQLIPILEPDFVFDADAYLVAAIGRTRRSGISLDEVLGQYRRHPHQQYSGGQDVIRLIEWQVAGPAAQLP